MHRGRELRTACKEGPRALPANRLCVWHSALPDGLETTTGRCWVWVPALSQEGGRRHWAGVRVLVGAEGLGLSPGTAGHSSQACPSSSARHRPLRVLLVHIDGSDSCAVSLQKNWAHACPPVHHFTRTLASLPHSPVVRFRRRLNSLTCEDPESRTSPALGTDLPLHPRSRQQPFHPI